MVSRETQVVGALAAFIIVVGMISAVVIITTKAPESLDENIWFRITADTYENTTIPLNSTLSMISITDVDGEFKENLLYLNDGEWQSSGMQYEIGDVLNFVIFFYETVDYYYASYRIGRGPIGEDIGVFNIEYISYWEIPNY